MCGFDNMMRNILYIILLISILESGVFITGCIERPGTHTQHSDDIHGIVTDKRVDTWGQTVKSMDYVLIMDNGHYYEAVVSFQKYASVKIGDQI